MKIKPKYFHDFHVGESFETEPNFISKNEIIDFASKYDPQAFHLDEEAAKNGPFGQLTSSGFMTLGKSFTQIFNTDVFNGSIIGTFYRRPSPDKANFVEVGSEIGKGDVLCVIEAMKLFNDIESEVSGKIVKVLVDDSSPVEFDQPLFVVDPS